MSEPLPMAEGERVERCGTCRWWQSCTSGNTLRAEAGNDGECRAHAPTRILADAPNALNLYGKCKGEYEDSGEWAETVRVFPLTYLWDFCGEWQAKQ